MKPLRCIVMGAAGRDFHDFQTFFRAHPELRVVCFTADQIPFIDTRTFPAELAGPGYEQGVPIFPEARLAELIREHEVDLVALSYSDLAHVDVMHKASLVQAAGASFMLLGPGQTQIRSNKPVVAVTAVRTGAGKSPLSQAITGHLSEKKGLKVGVLRHPMPYGDLRRQAVQRFATPEDLDRHECTVEEREEYEPYVERGLTIYAGVDYKAVLERAEQDSDVILWDGGNNDTAFLRPDLLVVVADALRSGHEVSYYPGETNFRSANVLVINKVGSAEPDAVASIRRHAAELCPDAEVIESDLRIEVDQPEELEGKRVLVIEDGPTVTHGGMSYGAGCVAARRHGAVLVDPREFAVGTVAAAYKAYPHIGPVLPALGYSEEQREELRQTIEAAAPDLVLDASPARMERVLSLTVPARRVRYVFDQRSGRSIFDIIDGVLATKKG